MDIRLKAIGLVHNERKEVIDDNWGNVVSTLELSADIFSSDATLGLLDFSHVAVIFYMDRVLDEKIVTDARHPRKNKSLPLTGILAQRAKSRVNKIGLSYAKIIAVDGLKITVQGLDAVDQTPILDIKPCMREFALDPKNIQQPAWVAEIMSDYY